MVLEGWGWDGCNVREVWGWDGCNVREVWGWDGCKVRVWYWERVRLGWVHIVGVVLGGWGWDGCMVWGWCWEGVARMGARCGGGVGARCGDGVRRVGLGWVHGVVLVQGVGVVLGEWGWDG